MDVRNAIYNMMLYQNLLVQTVESIIIKIQIKVVVYNYFSIVFSQIFLSAEFEF